MTETDIRSGDTRALVIFGAYLSTCTLLSALIIQDLFSQYSTRYAREKYMVYSSSLSPGTALIFGFCAVFCLGITWYYMFSFFSLSYKAWAFRNGIEIPSTPGSIRDLRSWIDDVRLGAWLKDVQLFRDAWEMAMETHGRLFWSQSIFFITTAWSFFVGDQGTTEAIIRMTKS